MSTPASNSNSSPTSGQPAKKTENEELHADAHALPVEDAERRGIKRNKWQPVGQERKSKKLRRRNYKATFEENIEAARAWLPSTTREEVNLDSLGALEELIDQLEEYGIRVGHYSHLSTEELLAKIKQVYAAARAAKEDPTDELWAVPDDIRAEIAAWKREAGLPEKYMGIHDCQGRSVDRPEVGCDFTVFDEDIYVCKATGIVHVCEGKPCSRATVVDRGDVVCTISASAFPYLLDDKIPPALALRLEDQDRDLRKAEERGWQHEVEDWRWERENYDYFDPRLGVSEEREWQQEDNFNPSGAEAEGDSCTETQDEKGEEEEEDWSSLEEIFRADPSGAEAETLHDSTVNNEEEAETHDSTGKNEEV